MIKKYFLQSSKIINSLYKHERKIKTIFKEIINCNDKKGKILVAGNGGSCSDAEHFVGELLCTYKDPNRIPISAISLASHPAAITAWSNDFGWETYFERQTKAHLKKNDLLFLISTGGGDREKGTSMSLIKAAEFAKKKNCKVISLIGKSGGELKKISDHYILVENFTTSHIQESHIAILHCICELLDKYYNVN
tara:strand:- start:995 stop:1576 length:582 start_codon:yes stop_codon:yes gene_type:complete